RKTAHGLAEPARDLGDELGVAEVSRRFDDRLRAAGRIGRLEDPRTDEVALSTQLHHQRGVRRRRDPAGAEEDDGEPSLLRDLTDELEWDAVLLRPRPQLALIEIAKRPDRLGDRADVPDRLDDVPGACLAFAPDHRRALV